MRITLREVSWILVVAGLLALVQGAYQALEINRSLHSIDRGLVRTRNYIHDSLGGQ